MPSAPGAGLGAFFPLADYLQGITEALAATTTEQEVIEIVLTPAVQAVGAVAGIVLLVNRPDQQLTIAGSQGYENGVPTLWQADSAQDHVLIADLLRLREAQYFEHVGALEAAYPELERRTGGRTVVANAALPMFLDNRPLGVIVLDFAEPHHFPPAEQRFLTILAAQCAIALGRAEATRTLEAHIEERTRQLTERTDQLEEHMRWLVEERTAQGAFVAYAEAVGTETDLLVLARQAITVLQERFAQSSVGYYTLDGGLWKAQAWSEDMDEVLVGHLRAGLPGDTPFIRRALASGTAVFTDAWNPDLEGIAHTGAYGAAAAYPLVTSSGMRHLLLCGLRGAQQWTGRDRALVQAVGRGLTLAVERAERARRLQVQNAELDARTRALEGFAALTRDLALTTDPLLLIRRAQEVVMSMLSGGAALYFEPEGDNWQLRVQHGRLHAPELQSAIDAALPRTETTSLTTPWMTGQPRYQDAHDDNADALTSTAGYLRAVATLPVRIAGQPLGVLAFVVVDQHGWSSVDRVILETSVQSLELALDRAAKTRRLDEERSALKAFTTFAEVVGSETDVRALVRQAITLLHGTSAVDAVYFERDGAVFRATDWGASTDPTVLPLLQHGFPLQHSAIAQVLLRNTAAFVEHWDHSELLIRESGIYQAVAAYPYVMDGALDSVLMIGSKTTATWDDRMRGIFQAVGRSLDLALDRARQTRTVTAQRDALDARTRELAARTQQLEAIAEELQAFSYSVSHDLRTPVRHILGFLQLARQSLDGRLDERTARHLTVIERAGTQMNTLIDGLLDLSRAAQRSLRPEWVDLNGIMAQIQATLMPDRVSRPLRWDMAPLPQVWGDHDALTQVLTQLIENALKFTQTRDPAVIRIWAEDHGHSWGVFVRDNGLGFDPRYQDRLFNLFQRLHSVEEAAGTGVGLASVRRLILKHGGQVFAEGQVDEGATFGFTLPKGPPAV